MYKIFGKEYYIDLDGIVDKCQNIFHEIPDSKQKTKNELSGIGSSINFYKYEIIKMCIDRIFSEFESDSNDELLNKPPSPSYNLAFNTLIKYKIIIEND